MRPRPTPDDTVALCQENRKNGGAGRSETWKEEEKKRWGEEKAEQREEAGLARRGRGGSSLQGREILSFLSKRKGCFGGSPVSNGGKGDSWFSHCRQMPWSPAD